MAQLPNPSRDSNDGDRALVVEVKPGIGTAFLEAFAPSVIEGREFGVPLSWQARAALGIAIQHLAVRELPISEDVDFEDPTTAIGIETKNVFGAVTIELSHPRAGAPGSPKQLDLSGVPVFLLTDSAQTEGLVVHPAFFEGPRASFQNIGEEYQVLLSPHYGFLSLGKSSGDSNLVARGNSSDGVVSARITERQSGEFQVSFSAKAQTHDPAEPGSITVEKGSTVFFLFVDEAGNKIDASGGADEELLGSQGSAQLDEDLTGICSKVFKNIPLGAKLVYMISPAL